MLNDTIVNAKNFSDRLCNEVIVFSKKKENESTQQQEESTGTVKPKGKFAEFAMNSRKWRIDIILKKDII